MKNARNCQETSISRWRKTDALMQRKFVKKKSVFVENFVRGRLLVVKEARRFIHLDRWHRQRSRNDWLMFISTYIFLYWGDAVKSSSSIINSCLEKEFSLKYTIVFSLVRRTCSNKKPKFFNFGTSSVVYEHSLPDISLILRSQRIIPINFIIVF